MLVAEVDGLRGADADALVPLGVAALLLGVISASVGDAVFVVRVAALVTVVVARDARGEHRQQASTAAKCNSQRSMHGSTTEQAICQALGETRLARGEAEHTGSMTEHTGSLDELMPMLQRPRRRERARVLASDGACRARHRCG